MDGYEIKDDGKVHCNYSTLVRCTPGQALKVAREILGITRRYSGGDEMQFGRLRHLMFEEEGKRTGRTPACFREVGVDLPIESIEREWVLEVFTGVVLHSRTDATSLTNKTIIDYKTTSGTAALFAKSMQMRIYGYNIMMHNLQIDKGLILAERWDSERRHPIGYDKAEVSFTLLDMVEAREWLRSRAQNLVVAIELLVKER